MRGRGHPGHGEGGSAKGSVHAGLRPPHQPGSHQAGEVHNRVREYRGKKTARYCRLFCCRREAVILLERVLLCARRNENGP